MLDLEELKTEKAAAVLVRSVLKVDAELSVRNDEEEL